MTPEQDKALRGYAEFYSASVEGTGYKLALGEILVAAVSELDELRKERDALRHEVDRVMVLACDLQGEDEDGSPTCDICGMMTRQLDYAHNGNCLANAIMSSHEFKQLLALPSQGAALALAAKES